MYVYLVCMLVKQFMSEKGLGIKAQEGSESRWEGGMEERYE